MHTQLLMRLWGKLLFDQGPNSGFPCQHHKSTTMSQSCRQEAALYILPKQLRLTSAQGHNPETPPPPPLPVPRLRMKKHHPGVAKQEVEGFASQIQYPAHNLSQINPKER